LSAAIVDTEAIQLAVNVEVKEAAVCGRSDVSVEDASCVMLDEIGLRQYVEILTSASNGSVECIMSRSPYIGGLGDIKDICMSVE
jgi:hypothetical protein